MGLREDAIAAAEAAKTARQVAARATLAARLDSTAVDGLAVIDTTPDCVVFGDAAAGLFLAVADQSDTLRVTRVTGTSGGVWTAAPRRDVDSLATLGLILDAIDQAGA